MGVNSLFNAYFGIAKKEITRYLRIWTQTLLPPAITTTLYFLIFGHVIGSRIGNIGQVNYISFITPGLIMLAVVTNSFMNVVSSFYISRYNRSIEELLVSPAPNWLIIAGYATGGVTRGVITGLIVSLIGIWFSGLHVAHVGLAILIVVFTSIIFALLGLLNAIFARSFDDTSILITFVLTPLIYLGGVFYSINDLPTFWRSLSYINPIYYIIQLFRYALLGTTGIHVDIDFFMISTLIICTFAFCLFLLNKGYRIKS